MAKLEVTKGVVRCRKTIQGSYKKDKMIDLQNSKQKFKDCNKNSTIDVVNSGVLEG